MDKVITCLAETVTIDIDAGKGVIYGVSVITEGEAAGHDAWVDQKTLQSVMANAQKYDGGLKVKLDHGNSVGDIVGYLDHFRIDKAQLRADFHLLSESEHRDYVLELASKLSGQVGMSISFSFESEDIPGVPYPAVRCLEIYSCDLVDSPAANPGGLFSKNMSDEPKPDQPAAAEPTIESRLVALEAAIAAFTNQLAEFKPLSAQLSAIETVVNALSGVLEEQKKEFENKLSVQAAEFEDQLKDANVLASRKLAATGVPAGKAPSPDSTNIIDYQAHLMSLKDPIEQQRFYDKNKEKIHAQFARR